MDKISLKPTVGTEFQFNNFDLRTGEIFFLTMGKLFLYRTVYEKRKKNEKKRLFSIVNLKLNWDFFNLILVFFKFFIFFLN